MVSKENNLQVSAGSAAASLEDKQRRRMLIALVLLLVALIVVLVKDRQFWFSSTLPSESTAEEAATQALPAPSSQSATSPIPGQPAQSTLAPKRKKLNGKNPAARVASQADEAQAASGPAIIATNRTVLPPLEVEVVAGNKHRALSPNNNSVKVDMDSSAASESAAPSVPVADQASVAAVPEVSARVTLPAATAERVSRSVKPDYPMLAKQMKVQGAVVLQALIDKAGNIQELHVVTGPAILATAAQEAVKQWRFKPYYQQGQAVETEARITVNFTISTY